MTSTEKPFIFCQGLIHPNTYRNVPSTAKFILGALDPESLHDYLYYDPVTGTLLVGHQNTTTDCSNCAIVGAAGINLINSTNTVVAGLDFSGLIGSEIRNFRDTLITNSLVTTSKVRVGSLIDQGSSVILPGYCEANLCIPYPPGSNACFCGERDGFRSSNSQTPSNIHQPSSSQSSSPSDATPQDSRCTNCSTGATGLDPILTTFGDAQVKGNLVVDELIYSGPIVSTGSIAGTLGSFPQISGGAYYGTFLDIPRDAIEVQITGLTFVTYVLGAPIDFPVTVVLAGNLSGFLIGQSLTFKDNTLQYATTTPFNFIIQADANTFIETRTPDGTLSRVKGGAYTIDTTGGAVTLCYHVSITQPLESGTWIITSEVRGNPRATPA